MRKLLASLLFLPVLFGGSGGAVMPPADAISCIESIGATAVSTAQLPLPGYLSAAAFAAPTALLEVGSTDNWRTPTRTGRGSQHAVPAHARCDEARTHLDRLQRGRLEFGHSLTRARVSEPTTFGNPPPASQT